MAYQKPLSLKLFSSTRQPVIPCRNYYRRWQDLPADTFSAQGNREQYLLVIPSRELVIVRLGWSSGAYPANQRFQEIMLAL